MELIEKHQDLFETSGVKVHCISKDCKMGAGIAKTFRTKYPQMPDAVQREIENYEMKVPCCVPYVSKDCVVMNLITKEKYYHKPTYAALKSALEDLKHQCIYYNIPVLCMPHIGCGLDRLDWKEVKAMIQDIFAETTIKIIVCNI